MFLWGAQYLGLTQVLVMILIPPPITFQNPLLVEFGVWIFYTRVLIAFCITVFTSVCVGIWIVLYIGILPRFVGISFIAFVKYCECERSIVLWTLERSFTNAQLFSILNGFHTYSLHVLYLCHYHWDEWVFQCWIQLHCGRCLNLACDHKCVEDWIWTYSPWIT
jgi:hypothetical protein